MTETFGAFTGRDEIAQAVVNLLSTPPAGSGYPLIVYSLAAVERKLGLIQQTLGQPATYSIALDFENWRGDELPIIEVVAQPTGEAERYDDETGEGVYGQWYEIQVAATVQDAGGGEEKVAFTLADRYGTALKLCLLQNGGLGNPSGFTVEKTILVSDPHTEFIPDAQRSLARSVVTIRSYIGGLVQETGPTSYGPNPYVQTADWPTIQTVKVQVQSQTPAGVIVAADGVTVTDSTGHVLVQE